MFIDDINHRYTYLTPARNIVWEQKASASPYEGLTLAVRSELLDVINRLLKKRPTWRFKSKQSVYSDNTRLSDFDIFDGNEKLGRLWLEAHWRDSSTRIYFNNPRLDKARQRNQKSYTSKPNIAAKRIIEAFHLKTPTERAVELATAVRDKRDRIISDAMWPLRKARNELEVAMHEYVVRNWDTMKPLLGPNAADIDLPALVAEDAKAARLSKATNNGAGVNVRIEDNGTYLVVRHISSPEIETFTDATLTEHLRGTLGLLKLVLDGTYIDGVGMRVDARTYFVMDKEGGA
jgi:hypothetical protein